MILPGHRRNSRPGSILLAALLLFLFSFPARGAERLRLATTTSMEASGLLGALLPPFERSFGLRVDVISVGTGKALALGEAGDVDVVLVHAPDLEERFVAAGHGIGRREVMRNDFVLVGPGSDPAGASGAPDAPQAFRRIAAAGVIFLSRADGSGTHRKERELWRSAGISPSGGWYRETGQGMGEVLEMAYQLRGYALSDRGTYLAFRARTGLAVLHQGDPLLRNPYGAIAVNPARHPHAKAGLAGKFIDFLTGPEGERIISEFRVDGEPAFIPAGHGER